MSKRLVSRFVELAIELPEEQEWFESFEEADEYARERNRILDRMGDITHELLKKNPHDLYIFFQPWYVRVSGIDGAEIFVYNANRQLLFYFRWKDTHKYVIYYGAFNAEFDTEKT